jgi:C6 transcription factor Pro1
MMSSSKVRSILGCWTCRLRRKKCDENRPICEGCAALEIDCLYSDAKPEWMDGGERQRVEAERMKAEVKRKAGARRERKYLHGLEMDLGDLSMVTSTTDDADVDEGLDEGSDEVSPVRNRFGAPLQGRIGEASTSRGAMPATSAPSTTVPTPASSTISSTSIPATSDFPFPEGTARNQASQDPNLASSVFSLEQEIDLSMVTIYLDYVFPFLFPFYRPALRDGGRGWLLVLLNRNRALMHTALSVASYFFSEIMRFAEPAADSHANNACRERTMLELQRHQDLGFQEMQKQLAAITATGVPNIPVAQSSRVLESIVQLLVFEVAMNNSGEWTMHLDACIALFDEFMAAHANVEGNSCWAVLQEKLGAGGLLEQWAHRHNLQHQSSSDASPTGILREERRDGNISPLTSDQAAMRFFTTILLQVDILASTGLDTPPKLQKYHPFLLQPLTFPSLSDPTVSMTTDSALILSSTLGLKNELLLSIAAISSLDSWKKSHRSTGSLSIIELVTRASTIEADLRAQMATYELANSGIYIPGNGDGPAPCSDFSHPLDPLSTYSTQAVLLGTSAGARAEASDTLSLLWAQAALTYLSVVVSGWQPSNPQTRASVLTSIDLFRRNRVPACLRMAVWPFAVTGCMAAPGAEQEFFREQVRNMGGLAVFGTIREALAIMENIWARRAEIEANPDRWDFAAAMGVLGRTSLLI